VGYNQECCVKIDLRHLGPLLFTLFINDLPSIIAHSRVLMYANDVKLCSSYNDIASGFNLQSDIDCFQGWCEYNLLSLNYLKCNVMTLYRGTHTFVSYSLQNTPLDRIYSVNDLGVLLDPKLKFDCHIMSTVNKAMSVLTFKKRWSKEFDDLYTSKLLFTSLVRPILEYCSSVWSPQYQVHIDRIESEQQKFLLFALRSLNWYQNVRLPSYQSRLLLLNLITLVNRRTMIGTIFMQNLIRGDIDSVELVNRRTFNVPVRLTRNYYPLKWPRCTYQIVVCTSPFAFYVIIITTFIFKFSLQLLSRY